jgi:hypothetical protein
MHKQPERLFYRHGQVLHGTDIQMLPALIMVFFVLLS